MKSFFLALMLSAWGALPVSAQQPKVLGETDTTWPGAKFQIFKLIRVDPTHVLAGVAIVTSPSAPRVTQIFDWPAGKRDPNPFSLVPSKLFDENTKTEFKAVPTNPPQPYLGENSTIASLFPNGRFQLAVLFPVPPPPPPTEDGKIPEQKVTFLFPRAKQPIRGVVLPTPTPAVSGTTGSGVN